MCLGEVARVCSVESDGSLVVESAGRCFNVSGLVLEELPAVREWVLVHSGLALSILSDEEARGALAARAEAQA